MLRSKQQNKWDNWKGENGKKTRGVKAKTDDERMREIVDMGDVRVAVGRSRQPSSSGVII